MTLQKILNKNPKNASRSRNKYSERNNVSFSQSSKRPKKKTKFNLQSLFSVFSVATVLTTCALLFVCVAVSLIFVYRYATSSDYFAIQNIEVSGNNQLSYSEVITLSGISTGTNSLAMSLDDVEDNLTKCPWVEEVSVKRSLPDGLQINIKEREAKFWCLQNGIMHYTDGEGNIIVPIETNKFVSLPLLEMGNDSKHIASGLEVMLSSLENVRTNLPADYRTPSLYKISQAKGIEVHIDGKQLLLSFGLEDIEGNAKRASLVIKDLIRRGELAQAKEVRAHGNKVWVITDNI